MQPSSKRRPGQQLTKDDLDDDDDEGPVSTASMRGLCGSAAHLTGHPQLTQCQLACLQGVDPGTWGKADAATMAKRKVIKVRRGAGGATPAAAAYQPSTTPAADSSNPFAGVSLTAAPAANPFSEVSLTAATAVQVIHAYAVSCWCS